MIYTTWNETVAAGIRDALSRRDFAWANFLRGMFLAP